MTRSMTPRRPARALFGVLTAAALALAACSSPAPAAPAPAPASAPDAVRKDVSAPAGDATLKKDLPPQLFAAHFVDSAPTHGQVFAQAPQEVVLNFNFNLHDKSSLAVARNGAPAAIGKTTVDANRLTMRTALGRGSGDGLYLVTYKACWPDGSCHDGQLAFTVDSRARTSYLDLSGRAEVIVLMEGVRFSPATMVISRGTKVTWTNRDPVDHFVNTDPHPSHNALPALNSRDIRPGQSHSFTFTQAGEWGYHCSAHVPDGMVARVVVQE